MHNAFKSLNDTAFILSPLGQGHNYIKRIFIYKKYERGENPEDYIFIKSLATDNLILMETQPDYIEQLNALPPKLRSAWLEGDWNIAGGFFDDFRAEPDVEKCVENNIDIDDAKASGKWLHVIEPFDIPVNWTIMRSFDWGYAKPYSSNNLCASSNVENIVLPISFISKSI